MTQKLIAHPLVSFLNFGCSQNYVTSFASDYSLTFNPKSGSAQEISVPNQDSQDFRIDLTPRPPSLRGNGEFPLSVSGRAGEGLNPGNPVIP